MLNKLIPHLGRHALGYETDRRTFLFGASAVAGGLMVGLHAGPLAAASGKKADEAVNPLTGYIHITPDNKVTILSSQFEMGQGPSHGLATLAVEELGADWSQVEVKHAANNPKLYGNLAWGGTLQGTGGSTSIAASFDRYRQAGAVAREMLVAAAAASWGVPANEISVSSGKLAHPSGKSAPFGEFAEKAAAMPVPNDVKLKDSEDWKHIGDEKLRRFDRSTKADGTHPFTIDIKLDGMLTAVMAHPPKFGAKVASVDKSEAMKVRGVVDVVEIPRGVAVVAEHMWAAIKGRDALTIDWDVSGTETRGSAEIMAEYRELAKQRPQAIARNEGDVAEALKSAAKVVEATYEFPYLAHAAMEPLNAVARMNDDGTLEVWGGHQIPDVYQQISA